MVIADERTTIQKAQEGIDEYLDKILPISKLRNESTLATDYYLASSKNSTKIEIRSVFDKENLT